MDMQFLYAVLFLTQSGTSPAPILPVSWKSRIADFKVMGINALSRNDLPQGLGSML